MDDRVMGSAFRWTRRCCTGAVLLSMMISTCNAANEPTSGPYLRASVIESSLNVDGFAPVLRKPFLSSVVEQFDDPRSTGWSIAAGWRFQRYFAIEAGFSDFGEKTFSSSEDLLTSSTFTNQTSSNTYIRDTHIDTKGPYFALVGSLPRGNWETYLKLGLLHAETAGSSNTVTFFSTGIPRVLRSTSEGKSRVITSTTEALAAIGLTYTIADHYGITLEAARIPDLGSERITGEDDLTSLSLALEYRF
jgi:hypothetical protein